METCPNCGASLETTAGHNPALCRPMKFNTAPPSSGIYLVPGVQPTITIACPVAIVADGRQVVRLNADGTYWVAPDITADEALRTIVDLARYAAAAHRKARDCDLRHKA